MSKSLPVTGAGATTGAGAGAADSLLLARSLLLIRASEIALNVPAFVQMSRTFRTFSCGRMNRSAAGPKAVRPVAESR